MAVRVRLDVQLIGGRRGLRYKMPVVVAFNGLS